MSAVFATLNISLFPGWTPLFMSTSTKLSRTLTTLQEPKKKKREIKKKREVYYSTQEEKFLSDEMKYWGAITWLILGLLEAEWRMHAAAASIMRNISTSL